MSSRSSCSEICRRSSTSLTGGRRPARPAAISTEASVTRRAKRSGRIAASWRERAGASAASGSSAPRRRALGDARERLAGVALDDRVEPLARLGGELRRAGDAGVLAVAERPRDHEPRDRVVGAEDAVGDLAVRPEVALDVPGDAVRHPDLGGVLAVAELPRDAARVLARVEVGGALEVVLGLGRVGDLAADAREAEHPHVLALVRVADEVELAALEQQQVGVDAARGDLARLHREVLELDPLAARDRGVDLGQAGGELRAAGARRHAERDRALRSGVERARAAPGDLLEREPQRLGVGELAVEQAEGGLQRGVLVVGEGDRGEVEGLGRERVVLLLGEALGGLVDPQLDAERVELGAVGVEAARERVLGHVRVALDVPPDLRRRDGPPLRHQVRDQRELPDQLLGVLRHGLRL